MPFPRHPLALLQIASTVAVPVALAWLAATRWPPAIAIPAFLGAMGALAAAGCLLLRTAPLERITWRNRVAGVCLPWANLFGSGSLGRLWSSSLVGSFVVGGIVMLFFGVAGTGASPPWPLLGAWLLDVLVVLFLLGTITRGHLWNARPGQRLLRLVALVVLQFVASLGLHLAGWSLTGAAIASAPQLAVLAAWLVWFAVVMTVGRNVRWN